MADIKFEDMMGPGAQPDSAAPASVPGAEGQPPAASVVVDEPSLKALDGMDPKVIFQYLKDKQLVPMDLEPMVPGSEMEMEGGEMEMEAPEGEGAPISFDQMGM